MKTYDVGTHQKHLDEEALLISIHNICFHKRKYQYFLGLEKGPCLEQWDSESPDQSMQV